MHCFPLCRLGKATCAYVEAHHFAVVRLLRNSAKGVADMPNGYVYQFEILLYIVFKDMRFVYN